MRRPVITWIRCAIAGGLILVSTGATRAPAAATTPYPKAGGVTLSTPADIETADLGEIHAMGANTVAVTVFWQSDPSGNNLTPGSSTPSDATLGVTLDRIRAAGMDPVLDPMFLCTTCSENWRGAIQPSNRDAFFASYRSFIDEYADVAQQHGVVLYFIGSEMTSTQGDTADWRQVANEARTHYKGRLAYEANFDVMGQVGFWDAVDVAGVSAYCPLSDSDHPTVAELERGWHSSLASFTPGRAWFDEVTQVARASGKPVVFGEVGYRSITGTARRPYDWSTTGAFDEQSQAAAYQALLETFENQPWWLGVIWWNWHVANSATDQGYTPRGKAAEQLDLTPRARERRGRDHRSAAQRHRARSRRRR